MPDDDITHPIPDLTGYITEGQIVLSRELDRRGVFPPIDVLPSLSRLMDAGIGAKTAPDHRRWSDQLYAIYAQGREARLTAAIVGESGLPPADRRALAFAERFEREFIHQGDTRRTITETLEVGWGLLEALPREDLHRIPEEVWARRAGLEGAGMKILGAPDPVQPDPAPAPTGAGPEGHRPPHPEAAGAGGRPLPRGDAGHRGTEPGGRQRRAGVPGAARARPRCMAPAGSTRWGGRRGRWRWS